MISVIVPVYRVEAYLKRCVDSIRAQTLKDLEIILVDDGSPDRSGELCDQYAVLDGRIRVIHQNNGGPSAARNKLLIKPIYYFFLFSNSMNTTIGAGHHGLLPTGKS